MSVNQGGYDKDFVIQLGELDGWFLAPNKK